MTTKSDATAAATIQLAPESGAPRRAREFLTRFVCSEGAEQYAEDGRVVVSELVTNAVRYSRTEMSVDLELTGAGLVVGVYDDGPGEPRITPATQRGLSGRGLVLVARLASEWGVQFAERGGKRVWCMLIGCVHGEADETGDDVMTTSEKPLIPLPRGELSAAVTGAYRAGGKLPEVEIVAQADPYAEHIEADAVHEQIARHDIAGGLLADEPGLAADVAFGAAATGFLEDRLADQLIGAWEAGRSSLRAPL